jgi:hypothetical protein
MSTFENVNYTVGYNYNQTQDSQNIENIDARFCVSTRKKRNIEPLTLGPPAGSGYIGRKVEPHPIGGHSCPGIQWNKFFYIRGWKTSAIGQSRLGFIHV